jgi:hypothetical protein
LAPQTLQTYKALVDADNFLAMGFDSLSQVQRCTLGVPMRIYSVGLKTLRAYQQGTDPFTLLGLGRHVIFPVNLDNQVRSSIEMKKSGGVWTPSSYGGANLAKLLIATRQAVLSPIRRDFFVVRVTAFNLYFISYVRTRPPLIQRLMMVPVQRSDMFGFQAGQIYSAESIFVVLQSFAQTHRGLQEKK